MPYKVFLNAPTTASLKKASHEGTFYWQIATSPTEESPSPRDEDVKSSLEVKLNEGNIRSQETTLDKEAQSWILPPATFGAASQRISEMYRNVIFLEDDDDDQQQWDGHEEAMEGESRLEDDSCTLAREESLISWPPTSIEKTRSRTSFSRSMTKSQLDMREHSEDTSYAHTSTSSIMAFPTFVINLHTLSTVSALAAIRREAGKASRKVHLLVAVLEVDGPDAVRIKKGPDAGKEVGLLKLVIGGEDGGICKLTAWREVADAWGGVRVLSDADESMVDSDAVRRGDIVYLENVLAASSSIASEGEQRIQAPVTLTASPNLGSRLHICYRTLPTVPSDRRFRPDLRLAASDPGLRQVATVVRWLETMMGLEQALT